MNIILFWAIAALVFSVVLIALSAKILKEYERGVIFRLGKLKGSRGPGIIFIIPMIDVMVRIDTRIVSMDVPRQEIITKDNVSAIVDAVVYYKVEQPDKAVVKVQNYVESTFLIAQTTLRSILGQIELDELLSGREKVNHEIQRIINAATEPWGINVILVEIKDVVLPETMKRAMARQAEVERERRAKIINAEGESQSALKLKEAARVMSEEPIAVQLRYLQTLSEIARENSSTIIFPFPLDFITNFIKKLNNKEG